MAFKSEHFYDAKYGKTLKGILTQAGTAAPTLAALHNPFGTLVLARTGAGVYTLTGPAGSFPAGKTLVASRILDVATGKGLSGVRTSDTVLTIKVGTIGGALADLAATAELEVTVYA